MSKAQDGGNVMERLTYWNEEYGCWSYHCGSGEAASRLAAYEETGRTPEEVTALGKLFDYALEESKTLTEQLALLNRIRDLAEADRDGRLVTLPFTSGRTLLCEENIDSLRLMKDVELAIRYCSSCGIVFYMDYNVFCDLVKQGRITAVSEEAEKVLEAKKDE